MRRRRRRGCAPPGLPRRAAGAAGAGAGPGAGAGGGGGGAGAGAPAAGGAGPEEMDLTFGEGLMAQLEALGAEGLGDLKPPDL